MRKQAGDDKRLFERLVWSEADKATLDKQVKGEVDVPDEVYGVLVEEPVLTHMGHATRRRLFSLEIKLLNIFNPNRFPLSFFKTKTI